MDVGRPYFDDVKRMTGLPRIFVASSTEQQDAEFNGQVRDNRAPPRRKEIRIDVIILASGKDGPAVEGILDAIGREVEAAIEDNVTLSAGGQNPLVQYCHPARTYNMDMGSNKSARIVQIDGMVTD